MFITIFTKAGHLSHVNSVQSLPSDFFNINFNIIVLSTPGSSKWSLLLKLPYHSTVSIPPLLHPCLMACTSHSPT